VFVNAVRDAHGFAMRFNQPHEFARRFSGRAEHGHRLSDRRGKADRPQPIHQSRVQVFRNPRDRARYRAKGACQGTRFVSNVECRGRLRGAGIEKSELARVRPTNERDQFFSWRLPDEARSIERGRELRANQ